MNKYKKKLIKKKKLNKNNMNHIFKIYNVLANYY